VKDFFAGIGMLGKGFRMYARRPGILLLGLVPAFIAFVLLAAAVVAVVYFVGPEAHFVTWFAHGWSDSARKVVEDLAEVLIVAASVLLSVVTFTAVTLAIGEPFYDKISEQVEKEYGGLPEATVNPTWYKEIARGVVEGVRLVVFSAIIDMLLFAAGFIPAVGQTVVPVVGALIGGWILSLELTGSAFARRGMKLRERRRMLRKHRMLAIGFGAPVFVMCLVPFLGILVMPAAVAGATLVTRRMYGLPS
jgi:CysZ protein